MKLPSKWTCIAVTFFILFSVSSTGAAYSQDDEGDQADQPAQKRSKTASGAWIGTAIGAAAGLLTGKNATQRRQRAMVGAGIGALSGAAIGHYQDKQEHELRERTANTGIGVSRQGDKITLNLPDNITFDTGRSSLKPEFYTALNGVASTIRDYNQTIVEVVGHTDNTGSASFNQRLSEQRAETVSDYLVGQGVQRARLETSGAGKNYPVASNATASGRARNRRVEIHLIPLRQK